MQCSNKLKQIVLAAHNYHDVNNALLSSGQWGNMPKQQYSTGSTNYTERNSGWTRIFPFVELTPVWDELCSTDYDPCNLSPSAGSLRASVLTGFLCPSSAAPRRPENCSSLTNYRMCQGDNSHQYHPDGYKNTEPQLRGVFGYNSWLNLSAIADGTSNTVFFGERENGPAGTTWGDPNITRTIVSDLEYSNSLSTFAQTGSPSRWYLKSRQTCLNAVGVNGMYKTTIANSNFRNYFANLYDSAQFMSCFSTIIAPNGPSCSHGNNCNIVTSTSRHSGGVQVALGDGSVRFVSDTIDTGTKDKFDGDVIAAGLSPFGVWGALGSRNGGESTAL